VLSNGKVLGCPCNVPEIFAESDLQDREWEFECPRKENGNDMTCAECWNREYKGEEFISHLTERFRSFESGESDD
jgi:hypothetical protein